MDFHLKAQEFLSNITNELELTGLLIDLEEIDHLCLRVSSLQEYEHWKCELACFGKLLTESYINGRPIAVYKLNQPIRIGHYLVDVVELPAPKTGRNYSFGFEHIEVVCKFPLENLLARRSDLPFSLENFYAPVNRDLQLKLNSGLIKFHDQSLEELINTELKENQKKKSTRLAIFDFDDTLVKSKQEFLAASRLALSAFLRREVSEEECREKARHTFPEFFANFGIDNSEDVQQVLHLFREQWDKNSGQLELPEGVETMLSCLYFEGIEIVVWTARDRETTIACLNQLNIAHFFSQVFAFDPIRGSKPVPPDDLKPLLVNRKVALVGDSATDLNAAQNISAQFFQAGWIHHVAIGADNDAICESPMRCLDHVLSYLNQP